jgi:protocatechuate 3,4-dioxygenase alpha subunit
MPDPTPSQTIGPFFGFALPFDDGPDATGAHARSAVRIEGQLLDGASEPVSDGLIEVWAGVDFARCRTDPEGAYHVMVPRPPAAPPHAPHLNVTVFARGLLRQVATRIYFPEEEAANAADPALARVEPERRSTLIAQRDGDVLRFDIHLQGEGETVFFSSRASTPAPRS